MQALMQAIRGMADLLPTTITYWQLIESVWRQLAASYAYQEIRFPILEQTALFARSIGEATDIVEKEMYTFLDRNGDSLTLRPEGTASVIRAGLQHGLLHDQVQRLWYCGPMFRHERPQKGRYRQFYQIGVEACGMQGTAIEVEMICMAAALWERLGVSEQLQLQINSLGTPAARKQYRQALVDYFSPYQGQLDEDSQRRLTTNPLRILDSKHPDMQGLIADAPKMQDYFDQASQAHFEGFCRLLSALDIPYVVNPTLVRGLDYYCHTVFEWVTTQLGAQGTVCAGGRYDGLVEQLGGKPTPAVGFALGMERLVLLLQQQSMSIPQPPGIYLVVAEGEQVAASAIGLAEQLRKCLNHVTITLHCAGGSFKSQFKKADRSRAQLALILGDDEITQASVGVKFLRETRDQMQIPRQEIAAFLQDYLGENHE